MTGEATWDVRDCPGMYHARLQAVRGGSFAAFREASLALRRGDPARPSGLLFRLVPTPDRGASGNAARIAASLAQRRGADTEIARDPLLFTAVRVTGELDQYLGQRVFPGLCAGAARVVDAYRQGFAPVERRLALLQKVAADARAAAVNPAEPLEVRARAAAVGAGVAADQIGDAASPLAVLARARAALPTDPSSDALAALSALEVEAWLAQTAADAAAVSQRFSATLDAILAANREACTCAF